MENQGLPTSQGQPGTTTPVTNAAPTDDWADAEAAYGEEPDNFGDLPNLLPTDDGTEKGAQGPEGTKEQPGQQATAADAPKEETPPDDVPKAADGSNLWDTAGMDEKSATRVKEIQAWTTKKNQAHSAEVKTWKDSYSGILGMINDVAVNPTSLGVVLRKYAPELASVGIHVNEEVLRSLNFAGAAPASEEKPQAAVDPDADKKAFISELRQAVPDLDEPSFKVLAQMQWAQEAKHRQAMKEFQDKVIEQVGQHVDPLRKNEAKRENRAGWESATHAVQSKYQDFPQHEEAILQAIQTDPHLKLIHEAITVRPRESAARGLTPEFLIEKAYLQVSGDVRTKQLIESERKKAIDELQQKRQGAGEKPGPYTSTIKAEGEDWDDIEKDLGSPFVYTS